MQARLTAWLQNGLPLICLFSKTDIKQVTSSEICKTIKRQREQKNSTSLQKRIHLIFDVQHH